ncbi:4Fe-4S dicluster domain-containing protein [uncultured Mucilaginibacter sp.]|uniref:4Fe-4S binding protein n=1 Tax=uncultured Mucilaginibacter sp. TaxID=797541 RepID=UPI0025CF7CB1|nr:4Fe-4S dicluster domain-containing protein [uncultured Mucilaginibacter sp.]
MFRNIIKELKTAGVGMGLTLKHLFATKKRRVMDTVKSDNYFEQQGKGTNTIQYPSQELPVPEVGRYQLFVEIDDCIVCDLCAKVCPVDCIEIDSIKSPDLIGLTSDGSPKRLYAAKFDIDMAKCMYCGLCTIVCPTECITMTSEYDVSVQELDLLTYQFSDMPAEVADEKRRIFEEAQAAKQAAKLAALKKKEEGL